MPTGVQSLEDTLYKAVVYWIQFLNRNFNFKIFKLTWELAISVQIIQTQRNSNWIIKYGQRQKAESKIDTGLQNKKKMKATGADFDFRNKFESRKGSSDPNFWCMQEVEIRATDISERDARVR